MATIQHLLEFVFYFFSWIFLDNSLKKKKTATKHSINNDLINELMADKTVSFGDYNIFMT